MAKVILLCGKIGCGKTQYAKELCAKTGAVLLSCDELMLALFGQDAGEMHDVYAERARHYLLKKSSEILRAGQSVVLDWGFWRREDREETRNFYASEGISAELYFLDPDEQTRQRYLQKRNAEVLAGKSDAYYVDEGLAAKCDGRFERPGKEEIDLLIP